MLVPLMEEVVGLLLALALVVAVLGGAACAGWLVYRRARGDARFLLPDNDTLDLYALKRGMKRMNERLDALETLLRDDGSTAWR